MKKLALVLFLLFITSIVFSFNNNFVEDSVMRYEVTNKKCITCHSSRIRNMVIDVTVGTLIDTKSKYYTGHNYYYTLWYLGELNG